MDQSDFDMGGSSSNGITINFDSNPQGANVYINNQFFGLTPTNRKLSSVRYQVDIRKLGCLNFTQKVYSRNGETVNISVVLECEVVSNPVIIPAEISKQNDTVNDNVTDTTSTPKNTIPTLFYVMSVVVIIVAAVVFWYRSKNNKTDAVATLSDNDGDNDTSQKIAGLLKSGSYSNQEMADKIGVSVRTIERNVSALRKEKKI